MRNANIIGMETILDYTVQFDDSLIEDGYRRVVHVDRSGKILVHFEC